MIQGVRPYPAYRISGVSSVGDVPAHWQVAPIGRVGRIFKGNGGSKEDEVPHGVPCVRYGDLYTQHEFFILKTRAFIAPERTAHYTPIRKGDVLFAASGETIEDIGRSAVNLMESDACCGGDVLVFRPNEQMDTRFLGYAAGSPSSRDQKARMGRGFTVVHIYGAQLRNLVLAIPPLAEQGAIVRFLDYVDWRIRRYIGAKQRLIRLLEEQKQAIIHRAVTRGLDPDVRLKRSGVEWLGNVPEHWPVVRLGRLLRERGETNQDGSTTHVLSLLRGRGVIPYDEKGNVGNKKSDDITRYKVVRPNDIVMNCMNVIIGSVGLSSHIGCLSPVYYVLTVRGEDDPRYLNAVFQAPKFHRSLVRIGNGILAHRMRIPMELLKCELMPRPPANEQQAIVQFLSEATADLDTAIGRSTHEIYLVREYRSRLIADVVTGKLDVREVAALLPDDAEEREPLAEADALTGVEAGVSDDLDAALEEVEA